MTEANQAGESFLVTSENLFVASDMFIVITPSLGGFFRPLLWHYI
ncbi:hypothetical protein SBF1_3820006 [Candidatus Desulfosporosinus infrequens]|uniref:Uncharacterized protein n=1 Tax=Candidatus Desulfosporosinus infrequens TaxID=2043169 RepID=A0A2U3L5Y5_9FIRM|nr:hypothetical protein SBF1_3820006 [Candidatus Desulfosporosinus infrequens]